MTPHDGAPRALPPATYAWQVRRAIDLAESRIAPVNGDCGAEDAWAGELDGWAEADLVTPLEDHLRWLLGEVPHTLAVRLCQRVGWALPPAQHVHADEPPAGQAWESEAGW